MVHEKWIGKDLEKKEQTQDSRWCRWDMNQAVPKFKHNLMLLMSLCMWQGYELSLPVLKNYPESTWNKLKTFPLKQCSPSNAAIMPASVTISVHTSNGEYMLLVSNTFSSNIYIWHTTIKLHEAPIPSTYDLTHNLPQPLVSEVLGQEKFHLRWHLVVLAFKLSHSSLALKYGGWRGWRDSPSEIQVCPSVCVCVCVCVCVFYLVRASSLTETPHLPSILQKPFMVTMVLIF